MVRYMRQSSANSRTCESTTVPHKRLLQKLEFYGIHGELLSWIWSFLTARTQSVVVEGYHSPKDKVLSGIPQGTVLGPLMFLCHINDLPSIVDPQTAVRLFTDDCWYAGPLPQAQTTGSFNLISMHSPTGGNPGGWSSMWINVTSYTSEDPVNVVSVSMRWTRSFLVRFSLLST